MPEIVFSSEPEVVMQARHDVLLREQGNMTSTNEERTIVVRAT